MKKNEIAIERKHVFLRRVSGDSQDIKTQVTLDEPYRNTIPTHLVMIFDEDGVSAVKNTASERECMRTLLTLVKNNRISHVYVQDRSRLFRMFKE
ncbi:MAG: recombinase family protein, partial [Bacilli bacterium]